MIFLQCYFPTSFVNHNGQKGVFWTCCSMQAEEWRANLHLYTLFLWFGEVLQLLYTILFPPWSLNRCYWQCCHATFQSKRLPYTLLLSLHPQGRTLLPPGNFQLSRVNITASVMLLAIVLCCHSRLHDSGTDIARKKLLRRVASGKFLRWLSGSAQAPQKSPRNSSLRPARAWAHSV